MPTSLPPQSQIDAAWSLAQRAERPQPVLYLDTVSATDFAKAYKQQTFDLVGATAGRRILEVGCGTGEDALEIARRVGAEGCVVAVDGNPTMVAEGWTRASAAGLPAEFMLGDAHRLDLPDNSFDGARSDRVFQHLANPEQALREMVRVTRPDGRVLISEPDWEALLIDSDQAATTRTVVNFMCDCAVPQGWIGRRLPGLFKRCGLLDVSVITGTFVLQDFTSANRVWGLERHAREAERMGRLSTAAVDAWVSDLEQRSRAGQFFSAALGIIAVGRKPR